MNVLKILKLFISICYNDDLLIETNNFICKLKGVKSVVNDGCHTKLLFVKYDCKSGKRVQYFLQMQ